MRRYYRKLSSLLIALVALCLLVPALAAERQLQITPTAAAPGGEKRVALVIGNSAYKNSPLRNPVNDARAISKALAATGFKVTVIEDATYATMWRAIRVFGDELLAGGVGLFYYAGHGMQVRGKNYLIPVNADLEREDEVEFQAVDANIVLSKMDSAKNALNLLILDACRNNPFARSFRSSSQGLAQMDAPSGTLVAFATAPGSVAADGDGDNGIYTKHLLSNIARPGVPIELLFKDVRIGVTRDTGDRQVPWESSSLKGNFFFVPGAKILSAEDQQRQIDTAVSAAMRREQEKLAAERAELQRHMERTIADLLAKQRAELELELKKRGETIAVAATASISPAKPAQSPAVVQPVLPPKPVEVPPPAATPQRPAPPMQTASIAPSAMVGIGTDNPRYPKVGDRWEYRYTDRTSRKSRQLRFEATGVSLNAILESGGFENATPAARAYSTNTHPLVSELWEYSPYLLDEPKAGEALNGLNANFYRACLYPTAQCRVDGKAVGMEKVSTPAGTFEALKVVIDINGRGLPGTAGHSTYTPVWRQMTVWYAPAVKRVVRQTVRTPVGQTTEPDFDFELTSYKLN